MITNISLVTVYVTDQDAARDFYVDTLGFVVGTDVTLADGSAGSPCTCATTRRPS